MKKSLLCLAALALSGLGALLPAHAQTVIPRYTKFETSWTLPNQTGNPYDPAQNDIDVVFHQPHGPSVRVPAFWDGERWRVRFAPTEVGRYTLAILRSGRPAHPLGLGLTAFRCIPSTHRGFVRRDPAHIQRFLFDNGQPFYPLGMDQAWHSTGLPGYPQTFQTMHGNGLDWARVWMNYWDGKNLEWDPDPAKNPPIGQYDMAAARQWDTIISAADHSGIYVQMVLQHHGEYTNDTDPNWKDNPFNVANGGFLQHPDDFFTNAEARRLTRNKYRYIVARWGYSTHLMAFELFNEVQNIREADTHFQDVVAWHKEMAAYLRSIDPDHHLITTSNSVPGGRLASIGLDYDQIHTYVPDPLSYFASFSAQGLTKPVFWGEWGTTGASTEQVLHDGLWSSMMIPVAGAAQFWSWDTVQKNDWWPTFHAATGYVAASGMPYQTDMHTLHPAILASSGRAGLSFAPPMGWGNTTSSNVTIAPDGTISGLAGVSSYIQGTSHRDMMPQPIAFHLRCARPSQFVLRVGTVSVSGAHPQISVDGKLAAEKDYPAAAKNHDVNETVSVPLTPGAHVVSLGNTGPDWYTVSQITITDYAPALAVLAKGNAHSAFFWAYNRDRSGAHPVVGIMAIPGLAAGPYEVHLWNTSTGSPLGTVKVASPKAGQIVIHLPSFAQDIAGWVEPPRFLVIGAARTSKPLKTGAGA